MHTDLVNCLQDVSSHLGPHYDDSPDRSLCDIDLSSLLMLGCQELARNKHTSAIRKFPVLEESQRATSGLEGNPMSQRPLYNTVGASALALSSVLVFCLPSKEIT